MTESEKSPSEIIDELNLKWQKIIDALKRVEYSFTINSVEEEDDDFKSPDGQPIKYFSHSASVVFNGFTRSDLYRTFLNNLLESFKEDFLCYVDDTNFLTSERLDFFLTKKRDIQEIRRLYPTDSKDNISSGRRFEIKVDDDWENKRDEYLSFVDIIDKAMLPFLEVQNKFLEIIVEILDDTVAFINGRLEKKDPQNEALKLNFNLQMSELIIFLLALRESDLITGSSDADLTRFAQKNLMWKNKQLRGVQSKISEYRSGTISPNSSFESLMLKLEKLKLPVKNK